MKKIVSTADLGVEFDVGVIQDGKIRLKLGNGLMQDLDGYIKVNESALSVGAVAVLDASSAVVEHVGASSYYAWERVDGAGYYAEILTGGDSVGSVEGVLPIPEDLTILNYL